MGFKVRYSDVRTRTVGKGTSFGTTNCGSVRNECSAMKGRDAVFPLLVPILAGLFAEAHVRSGADIGAGSQMDLREAQQWAMKAICEPIIDGDNAMFTGEEYAAKEPQIREVFEDAKNEAARLVDENIDVTTRVAERLLRRKRVEGTEIVPILKECRPGIVLPDRSYMQSGI
jgi:hypothetical protein